MIILGLICCSVVAIDLGWINAPKLATRANAVKGYNQFFRKLAFRCLFEGTEKEMTQVFRVRAEHAVGEAAKVLNLKDLMKYYSAQSYSELLQFERGAVHALNT